MNYSFNWDMFPSTALEASRLLTPLGCLIQKSSVKVPTFNSFPMKCLLCGATTSIFTEIDQTGNVFCCPFCLKRSPLPKKAESSTGLDVVPQNETVDYIIPNDIAQPIGSRGPVVLFVVDLYQQVDCPEEFTALKKHLTDSISKLSTETSVGLISFANTVTLHGQKEVLFSLDKLVPANYNFASILGDKPVVAKILLMIAESSSTNIWKGLQALQSGYFSSPKEAIEQVERLRPNLTRSFKPERSSGFALLIATLLILAASSALLLGKVKYFSSGPCTIGPGSVVNTLESMRTHDDIANLKASHFVGASKFYKALSYIGCGYTIDQSYSAAFTAGGSLTDYNVGKTSSRFSFDLFFGSLDQVGLYEMCSLSSGTGGAVIFSDGFVTHSFGKKLQAVSEDPSTQDCILTVHTSPGLKVSYTLSYGTPYQSSYQSGDQTSYHHDRISDNISGFESLLKKRHFTNKWYLGEVRDSVGCVLFEIDPSSLKSSTLKDVFIQFELEFWDSELQQRVIRSTTLKKPTTRSVFGSTEESKKKLSSKINENARQKALLTNFNPEAWITILTRLLISKIDTTLGFESFEEVINILDVTLMKIAKFFGVMKEQISNCSNPFENLKTLYSIDDHFKKLPILGYYLRKNPQLISIFNSSPDETAYYHHIFMGLLTDESCIMIQPNLYEVVDDRLEKRPLETTTVQLIKDRRFFVLDTFHTVTIYLHTQKDKLRLHSSDNDDIVYERKIEEVNNIIDIIHSELLCDRTFIPKLILTQTGHSLSRFLLSRLLPPNNIIEDGAKTKKKWWTLDRREKTITTDDISAEKYYEEVLSRAQTLRIEDGL